MTGLKNERNLEEGRRHQKIQVTIKVSEKSANQKLKSSLMYGTKVMQKTSDGESGSVWKPNHSTANTDATKP